MKVVLMEVRVVAREPCRRIRDSKENNMTDKFAILLIVFTIFIAAAWMTAVPIVERHAQPDWLKNRLNAHRHFVTARVMDDPEGASYGYEPTGQDVIRRLYEQCGSY
jgi:hypothetical protein